MGDIMFTLVRDNVLKYNLISDNDNIVAGISGGADSMALLYCLIELKKEIDFNIIVAHVNHGVRGKDALNDQLFVEAKAKELNLKYYTINVDMVGYGKKMGITAEEAGRELRYGFFREILHKHGGGKIAVAHNKNDQAETLLLRIMRGTGLDGLSGMEFIKDDIIRPILNVSRSDIEEYIKENNIETVLDKTNLMPIYSRNKVRLELIPYIENNFNPNFINTLWRLSQTSSLDSDFLNTYCEEKYNILMKKQHKNSIILNGTLFRNEHRGIQQRIIRETINRLSNNLQGFSEQHIVSIVDLFTNNNTGKTLHLPSNLTARVNYDDLIIEKKRETTIEEFEYPIFMGDNIITDLELNLRLTLIDNNQSPLNFTKNKKYIDYDKLHGDLKIRNRRNGDRFNPLGMKGNKKVKDYFIDEKIPRDKRDKIPILADGKNIIWIMGYALSDLYKITDETRKILIIELIHN